MSGMSDEDFELRTRDPSTITTHDEAVRIIEELDADIAHIQAQIDAYSIESNGRHMPEDRKLWLRRAAYAAAMKRNQRHRVMQRDKELRGTKPLTQTPPIKDPSIGVAKQARMQAEAEARRAAKSAEAAASHVRAAELIALNTWRRHFVDVVRSAVTQEQFESFCAEAKARSARTNDIP